MQASRGIIRSAQKICVYGPEGIGKSFFASKFPNPVFIDTEGSTKHMDVARTPKPSSWAMIIEQVKYYKLHPFECDTLVLDTADWAEKLCKVEICANGQKTSLSGFAHGTGYVLLMEDFGRLLNLLEDLIDLGINVVVTAHATMRKFEQPDEMGSYDRWEMKLEKKVFPLLKEWADMVLFANFKTYVVNVDGQGAAKGKNKVQGGKRVMYTSHHTCWDAKNRHELPPELPFDFEEIRHCIPVRNTTSQPVKTEPVEPPREQPKEQPVAEQPKQEPMVEPKVETPPKAEQPKANLTGVPKPLADLMTENSVTVEEIQQVVASRGYYPANTLIANYDPSFITGVLVGAWPQVFGMIKAFRDDIPF